MSAPLVSDPHAVAGVISLGKSVSVIGADPAAVARVKQQFASTHAVVLREFLEPSLLAELREKVARGEFRLKVHDASGDEECMVNNDAIWLLRFLLGASAVLRAVEDLTGTTGLTQCQVRVYRFAPDTGQRHDWHDDIGEERRLGLSINLSETMFEGGNLQLRERATERVTANVRNTGAGDAAIFRLDRSLQHQVLPVTGAHPRVVVAGWFRG